MKTVEFEFDIDQKVMIKPTGDIGVITLLGFEDGGRKYYVQGGKADAWWTEKNLTAFN